MELKCTDCMVTFEAPYDKDCPFCGTDAFVVEITNQPKLSIPKKIANKLDEELKDSDDKLYTFNKCYEDMTLPDVLLLHKNYTIICAYLAGKALGVELVEVEG